LDTADQRSFTRFSEEAKMREVAVGGGAAMGVTTGLEVTRADSLCIPGFHDSS
jgi:hypothetical protein